MTRVLLVGSGGREHAIALALSKSSGIELYATISSANPGIIKLAKESTRMQITNPAAVSDYAKKNRIELAVIGPEAPLVNGVADALWEVGVATVGPTRRLAGVEGDKAFCRELLRKHGIPANPEFKIFNKPSEAESYLRSISHPVALKPAGLTGGKGVKVSGGDIPSKEAEIAYARDVLENNLGGLGKLVIEERLEGEEYSVQAFVDGDSVHTMPLVQDHKRAYEGDAGPNTGGMGSYSDSTHTLPFLRDEHLEFSKEAMVRVVAALKKETSEEYKGILYGQFMLAKTREGEGLQPKLIEFNCRFGDPEAMNILPILADGVDFLEVCQRIVDGTLREAHISFLRKATVCKYLVPEGYPENPVIGREIRVDEDSVRREGAIPYYASVDMDNDQILTTASRTLAMVGVGETITEAERIAEAAVKHVKGPLRHRRDVGTSDLVKKRIDHVKSLTFPILNLLE